MAEIRWRARCMGRRRRTMRGIARRNATNLGGVSHPDTVLQQCNWQSDFILAVLFVWFFFKWRVLLLSVHPWCLWSASPRASSLATNDREWTVLGTTPLRIALCVYCSTRYVVVRAPYRSPYINQGGLLNLLASPITLYFSPVFVRYSCMGTLSSQWLLW